MKKYLLSVPITMTEQRAYTVRELAVCWNCSTDIVYDLLRSGKLAGFKLGKSWRISDEARQTFEKISALPEKPQLRGTGRRIYKIT